MQLRQHMFLPALYWKGSTDEDALLLPPFTVNVSGGKFQDKEKEAIDLSLSRKECTVLSIVINKMFR